VSLDECCAVLANLGDGEFGRAGTRQIDPILDHRLEAIRQCDEELVASIAAIGADDLGEAIHADQRSSEGGVVATLGDEAAQALFKSKLVVEVGDPVVADIVPVALVGLGTAADG
jgi:hypothetical protein